MSASSVPTGDDPRPDPRSGATPAKTGPDGAAADDPQPVDNDSVVQDSTHDSTLKAGIELAREALAQAKADALKRGVLPGSQAARRRARPGPRQRSERGGDPRPFGAAIRDLLAERGWEQQAAVGGVFGNWAQIVGRELAEHTTPTAFRDGEVVIAADSTAWATQVRLLASTLVRRLNEELGDGAVRRVKVHGPTSAARRPGAWRVR